eukprot:gnl/TRDRNA2_/TRDRNA2_133139_c2_seq1.p1 gnl/TRDRNA2_/TRDRNA2_133139_c2~~gnl/TRDRNA2_/TRDRNA2_133139_c2_seq1.p1  ORF type:complete len:362 (+),score=49.57 gnl/TRDRNA2_/TRDRNA2_133139_c2_seq1:15-1100(+)
MAAGVLGGGAGAGSSEASCTSEAATGAKSAAVTDAAPDAPPDVRLLLQEYALVTTRPGDGHSGEFRMLGPAALCYPPITRCLMRLYELRERRRRRHVRRWLVDLIGRLSQVPQRIIGRPNDVRFVALSDTHRYHRHVRLPRGEVLLFVGDSTGNYGRSSDVHKHFEEFLMWLHEQSHYFSHVFFVAGNHETLLDGHFEHVEKAVKRLGRFLDDVPNCTYLQNDSAVYRGLKLFGSPVTVSRKETEGKSYYSRAFERFACDRSKIWEKLPEGLDVLITHCPPKGKLCRHVGDPLISERLATMAAPPKIHVFGHDHDSFGIVAEKKTVFLNVAQDQILKMDPNGGGCALVFDLEARDTLDGQH